MSDTPFVREMKAAFARRMAARTLGEKAEAEREMVAVMRRHWSPRPALLGSVCHVERPPADGKLAAAGRDE